MREKSDASLNGPLDSQNLAYVEALYERWRQDPDGVPSEWLRFFSEEASAGDAAAVGPVFKARSIFNPASPDARTQPAPHAHERGHAHCDKHIKVLKMIDNYRFYGHHYAELDPLGSDLTPQYPEPSLKDFGLESQDLDIGFLTGDFMTGGFHTLREIRDGLRRIYCGHVGFEYRHIQDAEQLRWLRERIESGAYLSWINPEVELHAADYLIRAESFEKFLHKKFVGTKRFSLEGAEALIPALDALIEAAADNDVETLIFGMSHRGRINVLANILHKNFEMIFNDFEDIVDPKLSHGSGDVKYHLGYNDQYITRNSKEIWLTLTPNPSHLEAVDPVVEGRARARQDRGGPDARRRIIPILLHGDAAFAGQGLVAETLNLGKLSGYHTGGTIHIIINNQLGFTTLPKDARSTTYCTDVTKMLEVPIFHVNGDDVPAVVAIFRMAYEFRQKFGLDAVVDMVCFRRYGHSETDEPSFTQPLMYKKIDAHPGVRTLYVQSLIDRKLGTPEEFDKLHGTYTARLEESFNTAREGDDGRRTVPISTLQGLWSGFRKAGEEDFEIPVATAVPRQLLEHITRRITIVPAGFTPHKKILKLLDTRRKMGLGETPIDWGMGECLTWGTLVWEKHRVRLSGQDCRRGTFSHRHAVITDVNTGDEYLPLQHVKDTQAPFYAFDSMLSEAAVLGFEYGFTLDSPNTLVMWEAQFGDFANGAQVIIDQFIVSAETKWKRHSGLVLLLPHGYEGQGPEHSSARPRRFLSLCAECNIQVANVTTPAQYFHLLRRQLKRDFRKPLVLFTPKSLLRHKHAVSALADFSDDHFHELLLDPDQPEPGKVRRLILCTGKIYYDLAAARQESGVADVSINRLEQIYPFPKKAIRKLLDDHRDAQVIWVQEEPANSGAWLFMLSRFEEAYGMRSKLRLVSRPFSASPAAGYVHQHRDQQRRVVEEALGLKRQKKRKHHHA